MRRHLQHIAAHPRAHAAVAACALAAVLLTHVLGFCPTH